MEDESRKLRAKDIENAVYSPGGEIIMAHIDDEIKTGWEQFIKLPVSQKTNKAAYNYQAKYDVLKDLKEWIADQIKIGEQL